MQNYLTSWGLRGGCLRASLDLLDLSLEAPNYTVLSRRSKNLNPPLVPIRCNVLNRLLDLGRPRSVAIDR